MTATAHQNLLSPFLDSPKPSRTLTPVERQAVHADAVCASILALQQLLIHPDPTVVLKAADMILDLEKTRMRHNRPLTCTVESRGLPPMEDGPEQEDQWCEAAPFPSSVVPAAGRCADLTGRRPVPPATDPHPPPGSLPPLFSPEPWQNGRRTATMSSV